MRPRINPACISTKSQLFSKEVYSIKGWADKFYYRRCQALEETRKVAVAKQKEITILLNGYNFIKVEKDGSYTYIYNPALDNITSYNLKAFFIKNGCVAKNYRKVA